MWKERSLEFEDVIQAELALLSSPVRGDEDRVTGLLAGDFAEIGRSGRRWNRSDVVDALQQEPPRATPETSEWLFNRVADDLVLATYRVRGAEHDSRHSSLWQTPGPVLRFHQGTIVVPNR
ncbi:DUF4440 domain-containing protein [Herbiconiux sp.]|uniref:nuclear transport factor 2 family protein n=1 Tax=Herbiconiux sp. TaxID=1871186 RepID=UPI0025BE3EB5|nr:DUF4440 domain-containing protein [Herbiconiux sp.]